MIDTILTLASIIVLMLTMLVLFKEVKALVQYNKHLKKKYDKQLKQTLEREV